MGGERCATHDLALTPDGRCVLCRRVEAPVTPLAPEAAPLISRLVTALLVVGLAGSGAFLAYTMLPSGLIPPLVVETTPPSVRNGAPTAPRAPTAELGAEPGAGAGPEAQAKSASAPPNAATDPQVLTDPTRPSTVPTDRAAPSPASATTLDAREREERERDLQRKAMIEKDWEDRARRAARGGVSVTMYTAPWCGVCTRAREYMDREHVAYVARDVEESAAYRARARTLNPRGSVPTFDIDGMALVGFTPASLERALDRAAEARAQR